MRQRIVLAALFGSLLLLGGFMLAKEVHAQGKFKEWRRVLAEYKSGADSASIYCTSNNYNLPQDRIQGYEAITDFDYARVVRLENATDVHSRRVAIQTMLFGESGPSFRISEEEAVTPDYHWLSHAAAEGAERQVIDIADSYRLRVDMAFGLQSNILHHIPKERREDKAIIIFHKGHGSDYPNRFKPLASLIAAGHEVYEVGMPLIKENKVKGLVYESPRYGRIALRQHDDFWFMDLPDGSPLRFFVEPVVALVERIRSRDAERPIVMVGLSGGGWTTVLAAAIEPRIDGSVSVAGSWPEHLLTKNMRYPGDYEQVTPELYRIANRLELYTMAGYGKGRRHLQVFNERDTCCFAGSEGKGYEAVIQNRLKALGVGAFEVGIDRDAAGHIIGDLALEAVLRSADELSQSRPQIKP